MSPFDHYVRFNLLAQVYDIESNRLPLPVTIEPQYHYICLCRMFLYVPHNILLLIHYILFQRHFEQLPHISILPVLASLGKPVLLDVPAHRRDYHAHEVAVGEFGLKLKDRVVLA